MLMPYTYICTREKKRAGCDKKVRIVGLNSKNRVKSWSYPYIVYFPHQHEDLVLDGKTSTWRVFGKWQHITKRARFSDGNKNSFSTVVLQSVSFLSITFRLIRFFFFECTIVKKIKRISADVGNNYKYKIDWNIIKVLENNCDKILNSDLCVCLYTDYIHEWCRSWREVCEFNDMSVNFL